jgi:hypothetical protein
MVFFNQAACVFGGFCRSHRQISDLLGHYGKSGSRLAGPGCFHRGIQSQQIGLKGDFVNGLDDFAGFFTGLNYLCNDFNQFFQFLAGMG